MPKVRQFIDWFVANFDIFWDDFHDPKSDTRMLIHSDFWSPNVKIDEDAETFKRVSFLDWASFYVGNGIGDLAILLIMGTNKK